jgi:hypothetical protein
MRRAGLKNQSRATDAGDPECNVFHKRKVKNGSEMRQGQERSFHHSITHSTASGKVEISLADDKNHKHSQWAGCLSTKMASPPAGAGSSA